MSWLFSQALVEEFSAGTCSDGEPSAQLNVMPTPHKFSRQDKTIEPSDLSRFGLTYAVLTEDRGAALLTWYLEGFHARTSAPQAMGPASMASARDSGAKWPALFARYSPATSSWKTAQCSLLGALDEFSETWPRWGSMRNGESYLRPTLAHPICESASGLWQTLVADDAVPRVRGKWNSRGEPKLSAQVKQLAPTLTVHGNYNRKGASQTSGDGLITTLRQLGETDGHLNPEWAEWFMGWPIGSSALQPLEMAKFREWQQQHSIFSAAESKEAA